MYKILYTLSRLIQENVLIFLDDYHFKINDLKTLKAQTFYTLSD